MNCRRADLLIQQALDESLADVERRDLDAHLKECASCRAAAEAYRRLWHRANVWTRSPARQVGRVEADAFTAQVLHRIGADAVPESPPREGERRLRRARLHPLAAYGLLLAALGLLSWFFEPGVLSPLPSPSSADLMLPRPQAALEAPGRLWGDLRALPGDALRAWAGVQATLPRLASVYEALIIALIANLLLVFHAIRQRARGTLAR